MTAALTYTIDEAAARLGPVCSVGWLKSRLRGPKPIPHVKSGNGTGRAGRVAFTEAHLAEILLMLEVRGGDTEPSTRDQFTSVLSRGPRRAS